MYASARSRPRAGSSVKVPVARVMVGWVPMPIWGPSSMVTPTARYCLPCSTPRAKASSLLMVAAREFWSMVLEMWLGSTEMVAGMPQLPVPSHRAWRALVQSTAMVVLPSLMAERVTPPRPPSCT